MSNQAATDQPRPQQLPAQPAASTGPSTSSSLRLSMAGLTTGAAAHKSLASPTLDLSGSLKSLAALLPDEFKASDLASSTEYRVLSGDEPADEACQNIFCGAAQSTDASAGDCGIVRLADGKWACLEAADVLALLSLLFQPNVTPPHSPHGSSSPTDSSMHSQRSFSTSPATTSFHRERSTSSVSTQGGAPAGRVHAPTSAGAQEDTRRSKPIAIPPASPVSPRKRTASISQSSTAFSSSLTRESRRSSEADLQILGLARAAKVVPLRLVAGLAGGQCVALSPATGVQEVLESIAQGNRVVVLADEEEEAEKVKIVDTQSVLRAILKLADAQPALAALLSTTLEDAGVLNLPLAKSFESEDSVLQAAQILSSTQATTLVARDGSGSMLCGLSAMRLAKALLGAPSKNILHSSLASILPGLLRGGDTERIESEDSVSSDGSPIPLVPAGSTTLLACAKILLPTSSNAQPKTLFTRPTPEERFEPSSHGSQSQLSGIIGEATHTSPLSLQRRPSIASSPAPFRTHSRGRSTSSQTSSAEATPGAAPPSASSMLALSLARSHSASSAASTSPGGVFSTSQRDALARAGLVRRRSSAGFPVGAERETQLVALGCAEVLALLGAAAARVKEVTKAA